MKWHRNFVTRLVAAGCEYPVNNHQSDKKTAQGNIDNACKLHTT